MIRTHEGGILDKINMGKLANDKNYLSFLLQKKETDGMSDNTDKNMDNSTQIYGLDVVYKISKRTPFK